MPRRVMDIDVDVEPRGDGCVSLQVEPRCPLDDRVNFYMQDQLIGTAKTNGYVGTHFVDNGISKYRAPYILYYYQYRSYFHTAKSKTASK